MKYLIIPFLLFCSIAPVWSQIATKTIKVDGKSYLIKYDQHMRIEPVEHLTTNYKKVMSTHERNIEFEYADKEQLYKTVESVLGEHKVSVLAAKKTNFLAFQFTVNRNGQIVNARIITAKDIDIEIDQLIALIEALKEQVRFKPLPELQEGEVATATQLHNFSKAKLHEEKI